MYENEMDAYRDLIVPPLLSYLPAIPEDTESSSRKRKGNPAEANNEIISYKENRVENLKKERERDKREKMNEMYSVLQSVVPNLLPKSSRGQIITEAIEYVKQLEKEKARLEEMKNSVAASVEAERNISTGMNRKSSVSVAASGDMVLFEIKSLARRGLLLDIFKTFERNRAEVWAANVTVNEGKLVVSVTALCGDVIRVVERIKREILFL